MAISRDDLDQHELIIDVSPERFRAVAMPLLFDHINAQCEGTIAVNRQARIVWINDKYAEKIGINDPRNVLGKEIEEVLPVSKLREVVDSGQPSMLDLMAFGGEHFVVTRIPLRDEDGTLIDALGYDCSTAPVISNRCWPSSTYCKANWLPPNMNWPCRATPSPVLSVAACLPARSNARPGAARNLMPPCCYAAKLEPAKSCWPWAFITYRHEPTARLSRLTWRLFRKR